MGPRSEFDLIAAIRERLPAAGPRVEVGSGDDAAVVRAAGSRSVVSVDTTVDGVHARLDLGDPLASAEAFGWRALTTALSDLAAMGVDAALGIEAYVALTLPRDLGDDVALALAGGLGAAAGRYGVSVVGGDVTAGPVVSMSVTVVGWSDGALLTRAGARPGDLVGLTGPIGAAGAGLALWLGDAAAEDPTAGTPEGDTPEGDASSTALASGAGPTRAQQLVAAHLRPQPHLLQGAALRAAGATAAIDLSDGLLQDAGHVAKASGVGLRIDGGAVPLAEGVDAVARVLRQDPLAFAARSGEDFVLLVTVPPARQAAAEAAGVVAWIGVADAAGGGGTVGVVISGVPDDAPGGHDHRR